MSGRKGRKVGRNAIYCKQRVTMGIDLKNKKRRMKRHIKKYPGDISAASILQSL